MFNLIDHFVKIKKDRLLNPNNDNFQLDKIAGQQQFDHDVIHMMFIKPKENRKCLVFTREEDNAQQSVYTGSNSTGIKTGSIFVKSYLQNLNSDRDVREKPLDLMLRYENVHENLNNLFADFSD